MTIREHERTEDQLEVYLSMLSNEDAVQQKFDDIKPGIKPGRIVDHGCASAQLTQKVADHFSHSEVTGVDCSETMLGIAESTAPDAEFKQADIIEEVPFEEDSVDTVIASSTLHEVWSQGLVEVGRARGVNMVRDYLTKIRHQLKRGGHLVIREPGVPETDRHRTVEAWMNPDNRTEEDGVARLSTLAKWQRFAEDFVLDTEYEVTPDNRVRADYNRILEFMLTKDYTNVWELEMKEQFCYFSLQEWIQTLNRKGFAVTRAEVYTNPWIEVNRWQDVDVFFKEGATHPTPPTNMVITARLME
jgi:SAM-dependent methyltransferase